MKSKNIYVLLIICVIIVAGFMRDWIFISLNEKILRGEMYLTIYKWPLSLFFIVLYFTLTLLSLKLLYSSFQIKLSAACFSCVMLISGAFHLLGSKNISVLFMHIAQSPVILMILVPAIYLLNSEKK